jgi:hypothetical protein
LADGLALFARTDVVAARDDRARAVPHLSLAGGMPYP